MPYLLDRENQQFPDPSLSDSDGLLAVGGDLSPECLLEAYRNGIFPWYDESPILWWSLDPRMVLLPSGFRYSKSLQRVVRSGRYEVKVDTCFEQVMRSCAQMKRIGQEGSWITEDMVSAYVRLHRMGYAHSFETFFDGRLVGGLYGLSLADYFCGESMFHTMTDASKVAFVRLVSFCRMHRFRFIDAQQPTPHLASLGAKPIPRSDFLEMLRASDESKTLRGRWHRSSVALLLGGNQGDRQRLLQEAANLIREQVGDIAGESSLYETEPWGDFAEEQTQPFLNQALIVDTDLTAEETLLRLQEIERQLGRRRAAAGCAPSNGRIYASRPIDIDILLFNDDVVSTPTLQIPHPRMHLRRFALQPLCELVPDIEHPVLHRSLAALLSDCPDAGAVKRCPIL